MSHLENLNEEQLNIVTKEDISSAICIIAPAGSGKTRTIISKIVFMIKSMGCDPSHFFVTTFTKNATRELKIRLSYYLDNDEIMKMTIGTFHAIAYSSITGDHTHIVEDNIESYLYKFHDFIKDNGHEYKYIFIDEFQDINQIQGSIVEELFSSATSLVVVGDDQQNIYTFRKTDIKFIINFTRTYSGGQYMYLKYNYRCNPTFVQVANIILEQNKNKIEKEILAGRNVPHKKVLVVYFLNQRHEIIKTVNMIKGLYEKGEKLNQVAIMSRNNNILKKIECCLVEAGIPTLYIETDQNGDAITEVTDENRVNLTTVHGSKGLEFDSVYLLDVDEGTFPSSMCDDIEEERRLFYVAITRAKNKLVLCSCIHMRSQFIKELLAHKDAYKLITIKNDSGLISASVTKKKGEMPMENSINSTVSRLTHIEYDLFNNDLFNFKGTLPVIEAIHSEIPHDLRVFCKDKNMLIINMQQVFNNFLHAYIIRTSQQSSKRTMEYMNYVMYSLFYFKKGIGELQTRVFDTIIDNTFHTNLKLKTDDELNTLITYMKTGINIRGYIPEQFIPHFVEAYDNYTSVKKQSKTVIFDIFIVSLIDSIFKGRNSLLHVINFDRKTYKENMINYSDIIAYKKWFSEIDRTIKLKYRKATIYTTLPLYDKETMLKGIINIVRNTELIYVVINSSHKIPSEYIIKALGYVSLLRVNGYIIKTFTIYNPLLGKMYKWDVRKWKDEKDVIFFLSIDSERS
jgi:hypothetical protein